MSIKTESRRERRKVVAYLRGLAQAHLRKEQDQRQRCEKYADRHEAQAVALNVAAGAIERGEHLQ